MPPKKAVKKTLPSAVKGNAVKASPKATKAPQKGKTPPPKSNASSRASSKGKTPPAKGKGKKGKEIVKPKKESKKDKKLKKKYGTIVYDGNYVTSMRRDELEASAEKLREEVTLQRSERIKYQLERDFLYDLYSLYLARVRELELRIEAQLAENNHVVQDTEEMGIVKGQEGKHFRYEVMLKRARMDMSDELRHKKLLGHADRIWQNACMSIDEQLDLQDKREADFLKKIADTKEELNDLDQHLANMKDEMKKFAKDCVAKVQQSIKDCAMITKLDSIEGEEIMNEMLFASCHLNDNMFEMIQNYYNDMTSNNLNVIIMMRDRYEELFDQNKFMKAEIERFEDGTYRANKIMKKLKPTYNRTKIKHNQTTRLEQGNSTTLKGIELCDLRLEQLNQIHNQLMKKLAAITDERTYFRNSTKEFAHGLKASSSKDKPIPSSSLLNGIIDSYQTRYRLNELKDNMDKAIKSRDEEEDNLIEYFDDPIDYYNTLELHRTELNKKDNVLDRYVRKLSLRQWQVAEKYVSQR